MTMTQETSLNAYHGEIRQTLTSRHRAVIAILQQFEDLTNNELSKELGWEINRVTPRVNELVKKGVVIEGMKRVEYRQLREHQVEEIKSFLASELSLAKAEADEAFIRDELASILESYLMTRKTKKENHESSMKKSSKIKLIKIAMILQQIESHTRYNGVKGLVLCKREVLNDLGWQIEEIVNDELGSKPAKKKNERKNRNHR